MNEIIIEKNNEFKKLENKNEEINFVLEKITIENQKLITYIKQLEIEVKGNKEQKSKKNEVIFEY